MSLSFVVTSRNAITCIVLPPALSASKYDQAFFKFYYPSEALGFPFRQLPMESVPRTVAEANEHMSKSSKSNNRLLRAAFCWVTFLLNLGDYHAQPPLFHATNVHTLRLRQPKKAKYLEKK
jgi:hypothetical protein